MNVLNEHRPLADRMRPRYIDEVVGQQHLLAPGKPLRRALEGSLPHSLILWGPPGTGKTSLARLMADRAGLAFVNLSAVMVGVKEVRAAMDSAQRLKSAQGTATVLFLDEVHRFNKAQQDAFLPFVEDGTIIFVGATTENPSFELNNALLSRARTYVLRRLEPADLRRLLDLALDDDERGLGAQGIHLTDAAFDGLIQATDGDGRRALTLLELCAQLADADGTVDVDAVRDVVGDGIRQFDKGGDAFYDQISALHKSVRGSSPDAALYWLARMLDGGCDPLYIARRLVRMANEDIGNADPRALTLTLNAWDAQQRLGSPEGHLAMAQAVVYLACMPKSNAVYRAFGSAMASVREHGSLPVPVHLRNAPTKLTRELGHGRDYRYAHDEPDAYAAGVKYFPDEMVPLQYYEPVDRGLEIRIGDRLRELRRRDDEAI
ncbi:MAG: replication-associated recombination protein A [Pseudomonadota bacterium]|nr:replication-associated recombination protein A [Pseudomonadota bacterium]